MQILKCIQEIRFFKRSAFLKCIQENSQCRSSDHQPIFQVVESQRFSKVMPSAAQDCRKDLSRIHVFKDPVFKCIPFSDHHFSLVPEVRFFKTSNLYKMFQQFGLVSKHDGFRELWVRKRGSTEVRWSWIGGQQVDGIKASTLAAPAQAAIGGNNLGSTSRSLVCCCRLSLSGSGSPTGGDGDDDVATTDAGDDDLATV